MKNDKPEKMPLTSMRVEDVKREQLKKLFPEVFTEEKINFDQLKRVLGEWVEPGKERFGLQWPGKAECVKIIQQPSIATLKPYREESVNFDETENVFIEGDNLEALKLLQKAYFGKVKMIYIDPPYNTGKEFIYPDKYSETLETYLAYTGQVDDAGKKFSTNTEAQGRFHSCWLNMMYPRLYLARNLLREDGVIFISIDDHEHANLKQLCDLIYGEENFVGNLIWKRRVSSAMSDNNLSADHDYVLCYQKGGFLDFSGFKKDYERYDNPDNDPRGPWIADNLTVGMTAAMRPNQAYDLKDPKTGRSYPHNPNRVWAYIPESMNKLIQEGRIIFPKDPSKRPMLKRFQNELKSTRNPFSTIMLDSVGLNTEATRTIQEILEGNVFDYSKPLSLIQTLLQQVTEKEDLILDFFAGSGTTAHAVLEQNQVDKGSRKFICIQLPEPCDEKSEAKNAGYKTIADITKERIRRVIKKLNKKKEGELNLDNAANQHCGFKVFKLDRSNFKVWEGNVEKIRDLGEQLSLHVEHISRKSTSEDILYELLLKAGFSLTTKVKEVSMANKQVFSIEDGAMLICLEKEITPALIDALAEVEPLQVICLDEAFKSNDQLKANAVQTFKARAQAKESEIVFRTV